MDFHIIIVIAIVFLASLLSLVLINKIFRRKTFEEIIAEKKALTANLYANSKAATGAHKKPSKKKELKREKKQRQREQQRDAVAMPTEQEDSDGQSEQASVEDDDAQPGLSKTHVEFEPEPEVMTYNATASSVTEEKRRPSNGEKQQSQPSKHNKKDKKNVVKAAAAGILVNKNEPIAIKQQLSGVEELNNFDVKPPKDVIELRKQEKKDEKNNNSNNNNNKGKEKSAKKEKQTEKAAPLVEQAVTIAASTVVELPHKEVLKQQQQQEEKIRQGSPKTQHNATNNKTKQQHKKQQQHKDNPHASAKELVLALDKLSENETVGVSLFMNLFRRSELNRSEIQMLIDYLLNKQQDMPSTHSEWSDDVCLKLKRQLEEKEKALAEQEEASIGIKAKLRELRVEVNTERAHMNGTIKAYVEKLQSKEQEITGLNQEIQQQNDKFAIERQQFQAKLLGEKQQLQLMQNDLAHKEKCIAELTQFMSASRQAVEESQRTHEIIQNQVQQIRTLEQQRDELEALQNNNIFELEKLKAIENENAEIKVEIRNLQNALESSKVDAVQASKELEAYKNEISLLRNNELSEKQNLIGALQAKNAELAQELSNKIKEQKHEQTELQNSLDVLQKQLNVKEQQLLDANAKYVALEAEVKQTLQSSHQQSTQQQQELLKLVEMLKEDVAGKQSLLVDAQKAKEQASAKEKELLQQLSEQREKNNDIRMKNWKLIEALQNAEATTTLTATTTTTTQKQNTKQTLKKANTNLVQQETLLEAAQQKQQQQQQQQEQTAARNGSAALIETTAGTVSASSAKDEKQLRELFQRLYPDAVKSCAGTALSASFDQWVEQVLATLVKQTISKANANANVSSSNKSTQSNNNNNISSNYDAHNNINSNNSSNSTSGDSSCENRGDGEADASAAAAAANPAAQQELQSQNVKLRGRIDELTQLVTKTSNTVLDLENRAREQEANWTSIVRQKDEVIHTLQHSNGEQDI